MSLAPAHRRGRYSRRNRHPLHRASRLAVLLLLFAAGCAPRELRLDIAPEVRRPDRYVHVFFADGLRKDTLDRLLDRGELPNIRDRFIRNGTRWENTVVCLPSVTYANTVALLTGVHPGTHGVIGNAWFDAAAGASRDYGTPDTYTLVNDDFFAKTIHERLNPLPTANILCPTHRGASVSWMHPIGTGIDWLFEDFESVNDRSARSIADLARHANRTHDWPALTIQYFPGVDETAHRFGSAGDAYERIVRALDRQIGEVTAAVDASPLRDRTVFALVTDHSHTPAPPERRFDLRRRLEQSVGVPLPAPQQRKTTPDPRLARGSGPAVLANIASRVAHFHLWPATPNESAVALQNRLVAALLEQDCVDLVCIRQSDGAVSVRSRRGDALVRPAARGYAYLPTIGDPLGYAADPRLAPLLSVDGASATDWLAATHNTAYPDTPVQLVEMFRSPRAGDVTAFAADDWLFKSADASGHGSALRSDCVATYFFAGAGVEPGVTVPYARNLDLVPTLLSILAQSATESAPPQQLQGLPRAAAPAAERFSLTPANPAP
jgi:hypothetical protein